MFTTEQRDEVRERLLDMARNDPRVSGGALTGSAAGGAEDRWSDIDIAFGIAEGTSPAAVLQDWTDWIGREFGALQHWDLRAGTWIYRVFLLPDGLEVDLAVAPQADFGARGSTFRLLFGTAQPPQTVPPPPAAELIGHGWHHVLHAHSAIARGRPWLAVYWISGVRDQTLALACVRLGENPAYARGVDRLPAAVTAPLAATLVRSLDEGELRRALAVATACFIRELDACDPALGPRLAPLLREFATAPAVEGG